MRRPLSHLSRHHARMAVVLFVAMLSLGFYDAARGALLPTIRVSLNLPYGTIGVVLALGGLGYPAAVLFGGALADRYGAWRLAAVGCLLMAAAAAFAPAVTDAAFFALLIVFIHLGLGFFDVALNAIGVSLFVAKTALMMSYLHLFFGLGASLSPGFASFLLARGVGWQNVYLSMLLLVVPLGVVATVMSRRRDPAVTRSPAPASAPQNPTVGSQHRALWRRTLRRSDTWVLLLLLGCAISFEIGMATWHANFLVAVRGFSPATAAPYLSFFFVAFTLGRLTGGHIVERIGYHATLVWAPLAATTLFLLGVVLVDAPFLTSLSGYCVGVLFPTIIAVVSKRFVDGRSTAVGIVMAGGSALQMTTNWLIAFAHQEIGELAGFLLIGLFALGVTAISLIFGRMTTVAGEGAAAP